MAEDISTAAIEAAVSDIDENVSMLRDELRNSQGDAKKTVDGVTPKSDGLTQISEDISMIRSEVAEGNGGWFADTLNQVLNHYDAQDKTYGETQALQESMQDSLGDLVNFNEVSDKDTKKDKAKQGKTGPSAKLDDLKELPWALGTLGAVLANTIKESSDSKKKGVSGFFSGLMEGVGGIAALGVALLAFAGATLIFNFVDWGSAVVGMLAFTVFTVGMVGLAKLLGKETKSLEQFAVASLAMSAALAVFAVSLVIASNVFAGAATVVGLPGSGTLNLPQVDLGGAILALASFGVFELGMVGLARLLGNSTADFTKFALGSVLMCGALVAFSVALVIASNIFTNGIDLGPLAKFIGPEASGTRLQVDSKGAIEALATFGAFELGLAVVARVAGGHVGDFTKFALASIAMCGALVAFSFALVIVSNVVTNGIHFDIPGVDYKVDLPAVQMIPAIETLGLFLGFLTAMAVLANFAGTLAGPIALMSAVSLAMSGALVAFSFALIAASVAGMGGEADLGPLGKISAPKGAGLKALAAIADMAAFVAAFAAMGSVFLIPFAGAAMLAGIGIATGILLGIGGVTIVMAKALALAALICTPGGTLEWEGQKFTMPSTAITAENINAAFAPFDVLMNCIVSLGERIQGSSGIFPWQQRSGANAGAIRMVGSVAEVVVKVAECIAESMLIKHKVVNEHHAKWDVNVMDGALNYVIEIVEKLAAVADKMGWWALAKMPLIEKAMFPVIDAIDKMVDVLEKALTMPVRMREKGIKVDDDFKIDPKLLNGICDPVMEVLLGPEKDGNGGLTGAADTLGFWGAAALEKVTKAMLPVAETISILIDCITKAASLGGQGENARAMIDKGVENMKYLMVGDGEVETSGAFWWKKARISRGFIGMFNTIAEGLEGIKESAKTSCEAMVPLANTISTLVAKISEIGDKSADILAATHTVNALTEFLGGVKTRGTFWYLIKDIGDQDKEKYDKVSQSIEGATGTVTKVAALVLALSQNDFVGNLNSLGTIGDLGGFKNAMDDFDDGCKYLAKAYDRVKDIPDKWINTFAASFSEIDNANLSNLDKMALFSDKAKALGDTASNIERIAKAMHQVNKENSGGGLAGAAEKLGGVVTDFLGRFGKGDSPAEKSGEASASPKPVTIQKGQELQGIAAILSKWDQGGIKLQGYNESKHAVRTITV